MEVKSIDELSNILSKLSLIKTGDTFTCSTNQVVDHSTWYSSLTRRYYREDRKGTVSYIKDVLEQATPHATLHNDIKNAILGLQNLQLTYKNDFDTIGAIDTIIHDAKRRMTSTDIIIDIPDTDPDTIDNIPELLKAVEAKDWEGIKQYLYDGRDPHVVNASKQNALHVCAQSYDSKIMNLLIHFNVDVFKMDEAGWTPLYYAVISGSTEAVLKLEEYKAQKKKEKERQKEIV